MAKGRGLGRTVMAVTSLLLATGVAHAKVPWETGVEADTFLFLVALATVLGVLLAVWVALVGARRGGSGRALRCAAAGTGASVVTAVLLGAGFLLVSRPNVYIPEVVEWLACAPTLVAVAVTVRHLRQTKSSPAVHHRSEQNEDHSA
jgi:hypothetical protein